MLLKNNVHKNPLMADERFFSRVGGKKRDSGNEVRGSRQHSGLSVCDWFKFIRLLVVSAA